MMETKICLPTWLQTQKTQLTRCITVAPYCGDGVEVRLLGPQLLFKGDTQDLSMLTVPIELMRSHCQDMLLYHLFYRGDGWSLSVASSLNKHKTGG